MRIFLIWIFLAFFANDITSADIIISPYGTFVGDLDLRLSKDGRTAILLQPFGYTDPSGKKWETPKGWKVDGASIPWPLWSVIGSPWTGKYREASVIHDYYCDTKSEPWEAVHKTFYNAMLANNVDAIQAEIMYVAVYRFGPRWNFEYSPKCPNCLSVPYHVKKFTPKFNQKEFDSLKVRLSKGEITVDEAKIESDAAINSQMEKLRLGTPVLVQ